MPGPLPADYLQPGEPALRTDRRHPASLVAPWLTASLLWLTALAAATVVGLRWQELWLPLGLPLAIVSTVLLAIFLIASWFRCYTSLYLLTPERVYRATGRIRFHLLQTTYDKITDLHVRQGPIGRSYGFGAVRLETAGVGITVPGVRDPFGFKQDVEAARTRFLETLVAEHRKKGKAAKAAKSSDAPTTSGSETLWQGGPSFHSLVGRLLVAGFFAAAGIGSIVISTVGGGQLGLYGLAFLVIAFVQAIGGLLHFRYTKYEVTARGVSVNRGWLTRRRVETTFEKVTDVTTSQGLLGRLLDYGIIRINTAGASAAAVVFEGMADPESVKKIVDGARAQAERRA